MKNEGILPDIKIYCALESLANFPAVDPSAR